MEGEAVGLALKRRRIAGMTSRLRTFMGFTHVFEL